MFHFVSTHQIWYRCHDSQPRYVSKTKFALLSVRQFNAGCGQVFQRFIERGNINTAALVTIAQCNILVARCSRQLIGLADWVFVTLGPLRRD